MKGSEIYVELWWLVFSIDGVGNPGWTWPEILLSTEKPLKTGGAMRWRTKFYFNTWRCTAQLIMLTLENISSYKSALHRGVERWPMGNYSGLLNLYCYGRITQSTGQEILQQLCRCVALHKLTFEQFIQSTSRASTTIFRCDIFLHGHFKIHNGILRSTVTYKVHFDITHIV